MSTLSVHDLQGFSTYNNTIRVPAGHQLSVEGKMTLPTYTIFTRPSTGVDGELIYLSDSKSIQVWNGSFWSVVGGGVGTTKLAPATTALQIADAGITTNGYYWLKPSGYDGSAESVYVDFDGSVSGISDSGPWVRVRYAQDFYSRSSPWSGTGNSLTTPGPFSGEFEWEYNYNYLEKLILASTDVRQRFESWGYGSVGWTYSNGNYMGVRAFNGTNYNGATGQNIVKTNKPAGISHGVTNFNTFNNPTAQGTDPTDTNDSVWRVGVFFFRDTSGAGILPVRGIYNGDVDAGSEQRYFPFRNGERDNGVHSDIWVRST
jgi:hypothetical protein